MSSHNVDANLRPDPDRVAVRDPGHPQPGVDSMRRVPDGSPYWITSTAHIAINTKAARLTAGHLSG